MAEQQADGQQSQVPQEDQQLVAEAGRAGSARADRGEYGMAADLWKLVEEDGS